jgi:hypothetical protein
LHAVALVPGYGAAIGSAVARVQSSQIDRHSLVTQKLHGEPSPFRTNSIFLFYYIHDQYEKVKLEIMPKEVVRVMYVFPGKAVGQKLSSILDFFTI